eukprot:4075951-Pyramimonas_sp.AAC.1
MKSMPAGHGQAFTGLSRPPRWQPRQQHRINKGAARPMRCADRLSLEVEMSTPQQHGATSVQMRFGGGGIAEAPKLDSMGQEDWREAQSGRPGADRG